MTKTNTIRELLDDVAQTGELPDDQTIRAAVTKYSSVTERREVEKRVRIAAKKIVGALDSGLPDQAAEHAADVSEALSGHTDAGAVESDDAPWPGQWNREYSPEPPKTRRSETGRRVADVLAAAAVGAKLGPRDVEKLTADLHDDVDPVAFRRELDDAADEIRRVHAAGGLASARHLAAEHGMSLGECLREPEPVDQYDGVTDPRELAALLPRGGGQR